MRSLHRLALLLAAGSALAACAATPPPPSPPPLVEQGGDALLPDWRAVATAGDRDRLARLSAAWDLALSQARTQAGSGDLRPLGELIDPAAARPGAAPPTGDYRCRTVKLGSQAGAEGLGYVVYGWFACRVEASPAGLTFVKLTGSQRPSGLLYPQSDRQLVFLGAMALGREAGSGAYAQDSDRDVVAALERIGEARWRLVLPWPQNESILDLIELVPAN